MEGESQEFRANLGKLKDISLGNQSQNSEVSILKVESQFHEIDTLKCETNALETSNAAKKNASKSRLCCQKSDLHMKMEDSLDTGSLLVNNILPEEIWMKILLYCEVQDILAFSQTSKSASKIVNSNYFWKHKFFALLAEKDFNLDDYKPFQTLTLDKLDYKSICLRFNSIFNQNTEIELHKCKRCKRYTCLQGCVEDSYRKVAIDIGSKLTWIMASTAELKRHQSILGIPKVVRCIDCQSITKHSFLSLKNVCKCTESDEDCDISELRSNRFEYCSRELENLKFNDTACLYCKHRVYMHNNSIEKELMRGGVEDEVEISSGVTSPDLQGLSNGFCADAAQQMKLRSVDFVSPELALRQGGKGLVVATSFLQHILSQCGTIEELRGPSGVLVFCEAIGLPQGVRHQVLDFLFTQVKLSRVCLVPKPLAVCAEIGLKTSVIVDSGALHTTVCVVIGGKVILERCKELPVGGRHIAESLHCAHECEDNTQEIPVSSLDSSDVKEQCWLSYNMAAEEQSECTVRCESIWVPAPNRRNMRIKSWTQISLGNEVYRAPEYMYMLLDLPQVIVEVTKGLPEETLKECLSHIALTGGNTCLAGFELRLRRDLTELLPQYEGIIELVRGLGGRSCDAAVGATYITFPMKQGVPPQPPEPGVPCWISRDDYIFYGANYL